MAVNISTVQLKDPGFADMVIAVVKETGINPEYLDLEITETILMDQSKSIVDALLRLRSLGIHISLDDFGTGYSSLNYLQNLPIDTLKIDRSFINKLAVQWGAGKDRRNHPDARRQSRNRCGCRRHRDGRTTGKLQMINCDKGQGYFFAKTDGGEGRTIAAFSPNENKRVILHRRANIPCCSDRHGDLKRGERFRMHEPRRDDRYDE